jgi:Sulfotransferase family
MSSLTASATFGASGLEQLVYVCSSGRSGSTLLDMMLGANAGCLSLGEIEHLPKNVAMDTTCSCGSSVSACGFWTEVFRRMRERHGIDIATNPYSYRLGYPIASNVIDKNDQTRVYRIRRKLVHGALAAQYTLGLQSLHLEDLLGYGRRLQNTWRLFEVVAEVAGVGRLVDSSKQYVRAVALYRQRPSMVRVVVLIRDGRAVFNANLRDGRSLTASLNVWKNYYARALPILRRHISPAHLLELKYEDLVSKPESSLRLLSAFLGMKFEPTMLLIGTGAKHILNGNGLRLTGQTTLRLDERWKQELTRSQLYFFMQRCGKMNAELGYN